MIMGFNEILTALPSLTVEQRQQLIADAIRMNDTVVDHGVTEEQWRRIKESKRALETGETQSVPAIPYLKELLAKRYGK